MISWFYKEDGVHCQLCDKTYPISKCPRAGIKRKKGSTDSIELSLDKVLWFFNRVDEEMRNEYSDVFHELKACSSPESEAKGPCKNSAMT